MKPKPGSYGIEHKLRGSWMRAGYWKTLSGLRADRSVVVTDGEALRFSDYPFEPATVFPDGTVTTDQIAEVNLDSPSQLRLENGDIVFVHRASKDALMRFVNRTGIAVKSRRCVWSGLLDPFLDTWEEQSTIDKQFEWFAKRGLDRETVDRWRLEVAPAMEAYNFGTGLWEWGFLTFYDVLRAQHARLSKAEFADFYSRAMRLARIDEEIPGWKPIAESVSSALFSVLIEWYPRVKGALKDFTKRSRERSERVKALQQRLTAELTAAYSEPHRRYHTLSHLEHCLGMLRGTWSYAVDLNELRWAILFHDAIYDPRRQDNEARSADRACRVMDELERPDDEKARIRSMILATAHDGEPQTADEALLLDVDLSILGADEATFDEYDRSIRAEYEWVPEGAYREARSSVLESFLNRTPIYRTAPIRESYEASARKNVQRALKRLRGG